MKNANEIHTDAIQLHASQSLAIEKLVSEHSQTANTYGKLTALYGILNVIQEQINELESKLDSDK